jgi:2-C-methyl-D-erythritol 4-phosphate cytidylyltransferase/2-C-methyl-D-erythritol 2,4-cyclodiphosphate synthase
MWQWSARVAEELFSLGLIEEIVVVLPGDCQAAENKSAVPLRFAGGGDTRTESVMNGLEESNADFVMIHDAARPFLTAELCGKLIEAASDDAGAIPLLESVDSLKFVDGGIAAIPREKVFRTQTPQAFKREELMRIMRSRREATDEATLWIDAGKRLAHVPGDEKNFKITTAFDWATAKAIVEAGRTTRVGIGYDVHELVPGRKLILGGVEIASPLGLLGHSDADIICHAVSDALLGASGEGDIGTMFPASDACYKDAESMDMLRKVLELTARKGWFVSNVDVALVAQIPRIGDKIGKIKDNLKGVFAQSCPYAEMNVKAKSGEGVGSVGRAESMECFAAASIEKYEI